MSGGEMEPKVSISIDVADMKKAASFYTQALGCTPVRSANDISVLTTQNATIYLLRKDPGSNPLPGGQAARSYERHWTPVHLDFVVADVEQSLSRVLEHGGSHEGGDGGDWGAIAYCADPFGNGFCLVVMNE